jgi:hypothetical protein
MVSRGSLLPGLASKPARSLGERRSAIGASRSDLPSRSRRFRLPIGKGRDFSSGARPHFFDWRGGPRDQGGKMGAGRQAGLRKRRRLPTAGRRTECGRWPESEWAKRRLFPWLNGSLRHTKSGEVKSTADAPRSRRTPSPVLGLLIRSGPGSIGRERIGAIGRRFLLIGEWRAALTAWVGCDGAGDGARRGLEAAAQRGEFGCGQRWLGGAVEGMLS